MIESGTPYQWSVKAIYDNFPEAVSRWEALGQADGNIQWQYGREASALIDNGVPAMLVYSAIGKKAGVTSQTVRKAYYTWRAFPDAVREQYHLVPYTVFRHARACDNPEEVLQYYVDEGGPSVDEIEQVFPLTEEAQETVSEFPRYAVGIWRRMVGLPVDARERAEELLRELVTILEAK